MCAVRAGLAGGAVVALRGPAREGGIGRCRPGGRVGRYGQDRVDTVGNTITVCKRLLSHTRPYWFRMTLGILCGVLAGGSLLGIFTSSGLLLAPFEGNRAAVGVQAVGPADAAAAPSAAQPAVGGGFVAAAERLASRYGIPVWDGTRMSWQFVGLALIGLPLSFLLKSLCTYFNQYYMRWVGARVVRDLRDELFANLQNQSLKYYGKCDVGGLISRCTHDTLLIENAISNTIGDLTRAPVEIVVSLGFIVYAGITRGLIGPLFGLALIFPIVIVPIVVMGNRVRRYTRTALRGVSGLASRMQETLTGIRVVKAFHTESAEIQRFRRMGRDYFRSVIGALRAELLMTPLMELVGVVAACAGVVFCYARGINPSDIVPIAVAAVYAYRPIKQLAKANASVQRSVAAGERIFSLLDVDTALPEAADAVKVTEFKDRIVFDGVGFRYEPNEPAVLSGIGFELRRGQVIAFVGETGSGKTTIAGLLARFFDPTEGRVTLDGIDLRQVETASLRRLVGVVTQETILFNDTIGGNIAYGSPEATPEQIQDAARQANAHDFIMASPEGYERVVGEKGFVLSGGMRQRIAIARAILRNPPILILDEATSALDTVTERLVQDALAHLMQNRTVFAIAHRLSTIKHADQILVVEGGRIVERGTHDELYAAGGRYRRLCDLQFA